MLKILELFGGIGACSKALERLGIDYEIADYVEIDKYAVKSFNAIHGTNFKPQDICDWNKDIDVDLIMHGSPCQDFSLAGKQQGGDEGSGTRSSLMYETIRIVEKLKPKYVIWENVKNILSKKHRHNFDNYLKKMEELGYKNYYQVLNAKDYGIPQNRERVFMISIRKDIQISDEIKPSVRKNFEREKEEIGKTNKEIYQCKCESGWQDNKVGIKVSPTIRANNNNTFILEDNIDFKFPPKQELKLRLKDMLEDEVDEKYIISEKLKYYYDKKITEGWRKELHLENKEICSTICNPARNNINDTFVRCIQVGNLKGGKWDKINESCRRVYSYEGLSPTIHTCQGGNTEPKVLGGIGEKDSNNNTQWKQQNSIYDNNVSISVCTCFNPNYIDNNLRIRKLTPKECWRLMGFSDEDFEKAQKVNSNTQLYKQAGNSIVVNVLENILKNLL